MTMHASLASFLLFCASLLAAQDIPATMSVARVHGEATVSALPDQAQIDIGILTQGQTAQAAADENSKQANNVVRELRAIVPEGSIKTVNVSVNPNYKYPKDGGAPTTQGYTANNTVRVEINDLTLVRKVIDLAAKLGANSINRLNFMLRDEQAARSRALREAVLQAHAGAEAVASALQLKLGRVVRVEEGQPVIISPARQIELSAMKAEGNNGTPVAPGNIDVHATVNLTYELLKP